jgi:hypothetical protein
VKEGRKEDEGRKDDEGRKEGRLLRKEDGGREEGGKEGRKEGRLVFWGGGGKNVFFSFVIFIYFSLTVNNLDCMCLFF